MAFPVVAATNTSVESSADVTSHSVALPAGISSGDLLLAHFVADGDPTITWPAGWTRFFTLANAGDAKEEWAWREADGTEGSSITVTTDVSEKSAHAAYRITGHEVPGTQAPEASTGAQGSDNNPDPDSISPTGGAKDYLFIASCGQDGGADVNGAPANYSNLLNSNTGAGGGCQAGSAERQLNASTENPGPFTTATGDGWTAVTVVVHPGSGILLSDDRRFISGVDPSADTIIGPRERAALSGVYPGVFVNEILLESLLTGEADLLAALTTQITLASLLSSTLDMSGELTTEIRMGGILSGEGDLTLLLTTEIPLISGILCEGDLSAALTTEILAAAVMEASGDLIGSMTTEIRMSGDFSNDGDMTAGMGTLSLFESRVTADGDISGSMTTAIPLAASFSGGASMSASLATEIKAGAVFTADGDLSALLSVGQRLDAILELSADMSPNLTTAVALVAAIFNEGDLSAGLATSIDLPAVITLDGDLSATLRVAFEAKAGIQVSAALIAVLTTQIPDPLYPGRFQTVLDSLRRKTVLDSKRYSTVLDGERR